jgi:hypothetical protein
MYFTLPVLLGLTLLPWHQALALPAMSTKIANVTKDITTPYNDTIADIVDGLGASGPTWSSTPLLSLLTFEMPQATVDDMATLTTQLPFRLSIFYTGPINSNGNNGFGKLRYGIQPEGWQTRSTIDVCMNGNAIRIAQGRTTGGNYWVKAKANLAAYWVDTLEGKVITVFWSAIFQFGQNDPDLTYTVSITKSPVGWEQTGPPPAAPACPEIGVGTMVSPTTWSNLPWSQIISNIG